jgi:hypothetical protein
MFDYEQKYFKYKNKYLTLKNKLDVQNGGDNFNKDYVFFIDSSTNPTFDKNKSFQQLIEHLQKEHRCSMYFKINSNTIYPVNKFNYI